MTVKNQQNLRIIDQSTFSNLNKSCQDQVLKAESGDVQSIIAVANNFIQGQNDFPSNGIIGMNFLIFGASNKDAECMQLYGRHLLDGDVLPKDETTGINILNEAATVTKNAELKLELAKLILSHQSYEIYSKDNEKVNYVLAKQIFKDAADYGNAEGMAEYGKLCMKHKKNSYGEINHNFAEAATYFQRAIELGNTEAMVYLGFFYEYGYGGISTDLKKALQLYKSAKEGGNLAGYAKYGQALIMDNFGIDNPIDGLISINYAYQRKDPLAKNAYGCILAYGLAGFEVDKINAITNFFKARLEGCIKANMNIGHCLWDGIGIDKNQDAAIDNYIYGLDEGDLSCAYKLSLCYNDPESDIPVNKKISKYYLQLAYDQGYEKARKKLDKDKNISQNEKSKCCLLI